MYTQLYTLYTIIYNYIHTIHISYTHIYNYIIYTRTHHLPVFSTTSNSDYVLETFPFPLLLSLLLLLLFVDL